MTKLLSAVPAPQLRPEHRAWLNDPAKRRWLTWEVTVGFCKTFGLHPTNAGRLIAHWVREIA